MKFLKTFILVLLLALANCDVGRQNGHTDDDDPGVDAEKNPPANTKTDDQIETTPNANGTEVSSAENQETKDKPEEGELDGVEENEDANIDADNNDNSQSNSDGTESDSDQGNKLNENTLEDTPPTNTTEGEKPDQKPEKTPEEKPDEKDKDEKTPIQATEKSNPDITVAAKDSTTTPTTTTSTTKTTPTTSTSSQENDNEGEITYKDIGDENKDDTQGDTKNGTKTAILENVSGSDSEDDKEMEELKTQNYFMGGIAAIMMGLIIVYYKKQSKGETTPDVRYQRIDENDEEMGVMIPRNDETTDDEEEHDVWRWS